MNKTDVIENETKTEQTVNQVHLCVIMPAYNEGASIKDNLLRASQILSEFLNSYQIIVVNDGSTDNTLDGIKIATQLDKHIKAVSYSKNRGKGYAISKGVSYAVSDYIAFLDSDLELNPVMLRYFLRGIKTLDADIAIGSKLHKKSKLHYPVSRKILSYGYYLFLKVMFRLNIKDTQTGIKLFKAEVIKPICANIKTKGFAYDIEILATASKMGYKIIEMPIELNYSRTKTNRSKISIKKIFDVFRDTIKVKQQLKNNH